MARNLFGCNFGRELVDLIVIQARCRCETVYSTFHSGVDFHVNKGRTESERGCMVTKLKVDASRRDRQQACYGGLFDPTCTASCIQHPRPLMPPTSKTITFNGREYKLSEFMPELVSLADLLASNAHLQAASPLPSRYRSLRI